MIFAQKQMTLFASFALLALASLAHAAEPAQKEKFRDGVLVEDVRLRENLPVGENKQPDWTTRRRFAAVRTYVLPPWDVEVETWWRGDMTHDKRPRHLFQQEIEIGFPCRFQLDLYQNFINNRDGHFKHDGSQVEVRWALADWGKIPLNPTLYVEWRDREHNEADKYELKLLLTHDLAPRWHWALNLAFEQEVAYARETELGWSQALSYTLVDQKFSAGVEMKFGHTTEAGMRGDPAIEFYIGPSIQWRPTERTHIDLVPLFGVTKDSGDVQAFIVFGFDFGVGGKPHRPSMPAGHRSE